MGMIHRLVFILNAYSCCFVQFLQLDAPLKSPRMHLHFTKIYRKGVRRNNFLKIGIVRYLLQIQQEVGAGIPNRE